MMHRRQFLGAGPALVAAAALAPGALLADTNALDIREVAFSGGLGQARFEALLGESFYIESELGSLLGQLVKVSAVRQVPGLEQFSIWLQTSTVPALPEGTYPVSHYLAGNLLLHLQPAAEGMYRADFSLLR